MISIKKSQKLLKGKNLFCNFSGLDIGSGDILVLDKQNILSMAISKILY